MAEVNLTAEEFKVLVEANNIYLYDWRENDEDEKTAGWRHPGYFIEVRKSFDYSRLLEAGLMEKRDFNFYSTYRITELGIEKVKAWCDLQAPDEAPVATPAAAVDSGAEERAAELAGVADRLASEAVMLEMDIAEALGLDRYELLNESRDEIVERIATLQVENQRLQAALLECTVQMNNHGNDDNWETVTMEYAQAIKDGREVLQAAQAQQSGRGEGAGE